MESLLRGFGVIAASFLGFFQLNLSMQLNLIPVPERCSDAKQKHKWRNSVCSIVHAVIVGVLAFKSLPELLPGAGPDTVRKYLDLAEIALEITIGYSIFDILDNVRNRPLKAVWTQIIHHFTVVLLSSLIIWQRRCSTYGMLGLRVEINSIFLYLRQLLIAYGITKDSALFKVNSALNIVSFAAFRIPSFIIVLFYLILQSGYTHIIYPFNMFPPMVGGAVVLLIYNVCLFWRLVKSDLWSKSVNEKTDDSNTKNGAKSSDQTNKENGETDKDK